MVEFKRNKVTGILEAWEDGKKVGTIITMGDEIGGDAHEHNVSKNNKRQYR